MAAEWKVEPLEQLVDPDRSISYGVVQPGVPVSDGVPIVRVTDIRDGRVATHDPLRVSRQVEAAHSRTRLRGGELLLTLVGTVGEAAVAPPSMAGWNTARAVAVIPVRRDVGAYWVQVALRSPDVQQLIKSRLNTTVQATLNLRDVAQLPIPMPPASERRAITHILGTLDDKVELNRRMNETLEAMARALFKSWFVDFDPVRAQMGGRDSGLPKPFSDLFPARLVDSELGKIPEGWRVGIVSDLCAAIFSGGTPSTLEPAFWGGDVPWLSSGETREKFIIDTERTITDAAVASSSTRLAPCGATVIAGAGQGNTRGQTSFLAFDCYINQSVVALVAKRWPHHLFFDLERRYEEFRRVSDGHSSRGSLTTKLIAMLPVVLPPPMLLDFFERVAQPVVSRMIALRRESQTLAAMRDALLPKLMSGELRVSDADRQVARVT